MPLRVGAVQCLLIALPAIDERVRPPLLCASRRFGLLSVALTATLYVLGCCAVR